VGSSRCLRLVRIFLLKKFSPGESRDFAVLLVFLKGFEKKVCFRCGFWMINRGEFVVSCRVLEGGFSEAKNTTRFRDLFWASTVLGIIWWSCAAGRMVGNAYGM
jgi:hypothetical protein